MNETSVRRALRDLILDSEAQLVTDLEFQGNPRTIHQVTISSVTPPTGYFFISVLVTSSLTSNRPNFRTTSLPPSQAVYEVSIEVSDYIIAIDETMPFEQMDTDFQKFTDRVVAKIRENQYFTDTETGSMFSVDNDRTINKSNVGVMWQEAADYHAVLNCRITFRALESCTDDNIY